MTDEELDKQAENEQTEEELGEDPEILKDRAEATGKLKELLHKNEIQVDYWEADWKDTEDLITGAFSLHKKHPGWQMAYVNGDELGIDSNYVLFTSKPVDESVVHEIMSLIVEEGAELPELPPEPQCPTCGDPLVIIAQHDYQIAFEHGQWVKDTGDVSYICNNCREELDTHDPVVEAALKATDEL